MTTNINEPKMPSNPFPSDTATSTILTRKKSYFISEIERKSDFPASIILGILALCFLLVCFGNMELHLTNLVSIVFPIYWTMKAIEHPEQDDRKQWYAYWPIWSFYFLLDLLFPNILNIIPLFYPAKLLFFIWLFLPSTKGALFLYQTVFSHIHSPFDLSRITAITDSIKNRFNKLLDFYIGESREIIRNIKPEEEEIEREKKTAEEIVREVIGKPEIGQASETSFKLVDAQPRPGIVNEMPEESEIITGNYSRPFEEEEQHESRQNIVGNAKIDTQNLTTNLQGVKDQFSQSLNRLKEVRENLVSTDTTMTKNLTEIKENINPNLVTYKKKEEKKLPLSQYQLEKKVL